jgi:hypothetical protein
MHTGFELYSNKAQNRAAQKIPINRPKKAKKGCSTTTGIPEVHTVSELRSSNSEICNG